ncbi:MAG: CerR family C-terminal domain-containing protein [Rhodobacterales bacterium]|nr:CerR family C-terminal domain-containing protein [Rhodobacterales bacterium]
MPLPAPDSRTPDPKTPDSRTPGPKTPDPKTPDPKTPDPGAPGADTRRRLIEAGRRLFAADGFRGVSARRLTAAAEVNLAAVGYHFGGMRELYLAVVEDVVLATDVHIGPLVARLSATLEGAPGRAALGAAATDLVATLIGMLLNDESRMRDRAALVLRELAQPTEAFDTLYRHRFAPLHGAVTRLVAAATGRDPADPACIIRAHAVLANMMMFGLARRVLLRRLERDAYGPDLTATIVREVTESVLASLDLPRPAPGVPPHAP